MIITTQSGAEIEVQQADKEHFALTILVKNWRKEIYLSLTRGEIQVLSLEINKKLNED